MKTNKRYELKTFVGPLEFRRIEKVIQRYRNSKEELYQVTSTYYDTFDLHHLKNKIEGEFLKRKFRYRSYVDLKSAIEVPSYFEVKYKEGIQNYKKRYQIKSYEINDHLKRVDSLKDRQLKSVLSVKYTRKSYEFFYYNQKIRLTFDFDLHFTKINNSYKSRNNKIICELKFESFDNQIYHLMNLLSFKRMCISKYQMGAKCLNII